MKLATLVYVRQGDATLMLHRIKKAQDMHAGKWNGLGGKLEAGETPEACAIREVFEESGLTIRNPVLRGFLTFPAFAKEEDWYVFLLVATEFGGALIDSPEGVLRWVPNAELPALPMWEGDSIFMAWLDEPGFFSARFAYDGGIYRGFEGWCYLPDGSVRRLASEVVADPPSASLPVLRPVPDAVPEPVATTQSAFDDQQCWLCGGATDRRNCKIVCRVCGFLRDCSDP